MGDLLGLQSFVMLADEERPQSGSWWPVMIWPLMLFGTCFFVVHLASSCGLSWTAVGSEGGLVVGCCIVFDLQKSIKGAFSLTCIVSHSFLLQKDKAPKVRACDALKGEVHPCLMDGRTKCSKRARSSTNVREAWSPSLVKHG
jgi:hypothetical protein